MKHEKTAKRLRIALNVSGLTAAELHRKTDVSEASLSHYLSGRHIPGNITAGKLSKILGVSPIWLMGYDVLSGCEEIDNPAAVTKTFILNDDESELISTYKKLNTLGRSKARDYVSDLAENDKYTKDTASPAEEAM